VTVCQLFIDFKKAYDSVKRYLQHSRRVWVTHEDRLIKVCLNETYSKVCTGKHLSYNFPIENGLKQRDALLPLLFNSVLEYARKTRWD
jgi:hypothetical protein